MNYTVVPREAIPALWEGLHGLLAPALAQEPVDQTAAVYESLCDGRMTAWLVSGEASGVLVTRVDEDDGVKTARARYVAGVGRSLSHMKQVLFDFEAGARLIGCQQVRLGGRRGWLRIARDYDVLSDVDGHVELVKVL